VTEVVIYVEKLIIHTKDLTTCKWASSIRYAFFSSIGSQFPGMAPLNHVPLMIGIGDSILKRKIKKNQVKLILYC